LRSPNPCGEAPKRWGTEHGMIPGSENPDRRAPVEIEECPTLWGIAKIVGVWSAE